MKFCSNCGHPVVFKAVPGDTHMRFVCESCNTIHYQNPNVVAGCLPLWEDKVLLCRRAIEPRLGFWNVPGGYLENGESVEEGAVREVMEEACTHVDITGLHMVYSIPHINQVYMHFLGDLKQLDFAPGIESLEVQLFREEDIPWEEIAFGSSVFTLRRFFEDRKAGIRQVHVGGFRKK
ncbi:MAG: NUDIX hydrolase [Bacteroidota bacterium]